MKQRYAVMACLCGGLAWLGSAHAQKETSWPSFGNDPGAMRYSALTQINTENVTQLKLAWKFDTSSVQGNAAPETAPVENHSIGAEPPAQPASSEGKPHLGRLRFRILRRTEDIPIVVDGAMYISTAYHQILALNAETGKVMWDYNSPHPPALRGISYWPGTKGYAPEIVYGTLDGFLVALDAKTGKPVETFADKGELDLKTFSNSPRYANSRRSVTSPVVFYRNLVIPGCSPGERPAFGAKCDIQAFDMRTGKLVWTFHTVPRPGEPNHDVWKDGQWEDRSGVNNWGFMSVDVKRGMLFVPLGTPNTDFYGGNRQGSNLYGTSLVALDANTGKLKWYFQTVHHDNWDYDDNAAPILFNVKRHGHEIPAVGQITKQGYLFIFNRETGKPIYDVKEMPIENDNPMPGDQQWPTQPVPVKPPVLSRNRFSPDDIATVTPEHEQYCKNLLALEGGAIGGGPFAQYGPKLRVIFPSWTGGPNWGSAMFDPQLGYFIVDSKDLANFNKMVPDGHGGWNRVPPDHAPTGLGDNFWDGQKKWPCQQPPWSRLIAVNVNTGEIAWQVPFGSFEELDKLGVPTTGTPTTNGGGISTAGGLIFIGATVDGKFRAYDAHNGKQLWEQNLNADVNSIPITWMGKDGKQYVAVFANGGIHNGAKPTFLYVYSL